MPVVWVSRHKLNDLNRKILDKAFRRWVVVDWVKGTVSPDDLRMLVEKYNNAVFVVVLPPDLLMHLLRYTDKVFRFIVERKVDNEGNAIFIPVGLEQVLEVSIKTRRVV